MKRFVLILFLSLPAAGEDLPRFTTWKASLVALNGAHVADTLSTLYAMKNPDAVEAHPFFGRRFDGKDAALKTGIVLGVTVMQYFVVRKHPKAARFLAKINFVTAGGLGVIAARNWRLPR